MNFFFCDAFFYFNFKIQDFSNALLLKHYALQFLTLIKI